MKKGGGYYYDFSRPPIGNKLSVGKYTNCCRPVFCGNLTEGIFQNGGNHILLNNISNLYNEDNTKEMIQKSTNNNVININKYYKFFNKKTLETLSMILYADYLNKNNKNQKGGMVIINNIKMKKEIILKIKRIFKYINEHE